MEEPAVRPRADYPTSIKELPFWGCVVLVYHIVVIIWVLQFLAGLQALNGGLTDASTVVRAQSILASGALGGALLASRWVVYSLRHGRYDVRRLPWQVVTPITSAVLALVGVLLVHGGFIGTTANWNAAEPEYTFAVLGFAFVVGFAAESFVKRLIMAAESLFGERGDLEDRWEED